MSDPVTAESGPLKRTMEQSPYPHRWRAVCIQCGWSTSGYDKHYVDGAADTHHILKPGHWDVAVRPIPAEPAGDRLEMLRARLSALRERQANLDAEIAMLEAEIAKLMPEERP